MYSAIPSLANMFVVILSGQIADYMRSTWFSTTLVRKTFTVVGVCKFCEVVDPLHGSCEQAAL